MKSINRFDTDLYTRSEQTIAHGALTNSKRPESFVKGIYPTHLIRGEGAYVYDSLGNKYIDCIAGLGTNLIGYEVDELAAAVDKAYRQGASLSLGTNTEVLAAERMREFFPYMEKVRFLKTGSEACQAAIRIARAFTKNYTIISEGYHGWLDEFVSLTPPANGVVAQRLYMRKLEDYHLKEGNLIGVAAIIIEPIITDLSEARIDWLRKLRSRTLADNCLLIFDETITGFRFPNFSVANYLGISPDLSIMGKAMGAGLPLSCVSGKAVIMDTDYFVSSTFAGDRVSLSAFLKLSELLNSKYQISDLWSKGESFLTKFNSIWPEGIRLEGYPTRSALLGEDLKKALFMQECCKGGILMGPSFFFTFPLIELVDEMLSIFTDVLWRIRLGQVKLEGEMPIQPFAQKIREAA